MTTQNATERRRYNLLKALQETAPECQILRDEIATRRKHTVGNGQTRYCRG